MTTLVVRVSGVEVGTLEYFEDQMDDYVLTFDPSWRDDPERPVLGQVFIDKLSRRGACSFSGPPCWFTHILPQGALRRAIERAAGPAPTAFDLLGLLGSDLPGAITLAVGPASGVRRPPTRVVPDASSLAVWPALAGMQMKMSVRRRERGLVVGVQSDARDLIAKFWSPDFRDLPRVEHATMRWASACGVDVPRCELLDRPPIEGLPDGVPLGDGKVFLIERFDRTEGGGRVHFEDLAQALDHVLDEEALNGYYASRYETIAATLARLCPTDLRAYVERVVFCVLAGNGDAHLKNWALLYPDGRTATLAPAYDLVATIVYPERLCARELALSLNNSRRFEDVSLGSFVKLAALIDVPFEVVAAWVTEMAVRVRSSWANAPAREHFSAQERKKIDAHLARVPLP